MKKQTYGRKVHKFVKDSSFDQVITTFGKVMLDSTKELERIITKYETEKVPLTDEEITLCIDWANCAYIVFTKYFKEKTNETTNHK